MLLNDAAFAELKRVGSFPGSSATHRYPLCNFCSCSLPHHSTFMFFFGAPTLAVAESILSHPSTINEWRVREAAE